MPERSSKVRRTGVVVESAQTHGKSRMSTSTYDVEAYEGNTRNVYLGLADGHITQDSIKCFF